MKGRVGLLVTRVSCHILIVNRKLSKALIVLDFPDIP